MIETRKLPTRCIQGRWEVLLDCPDVWLEVDSEKDAEAIAVGWQRATTKDGAGDDSELAKFLEDSAATFEGFWGGPGLYSRYLKAKAAQVRHHHESPSPM